MVLVFASISIFISIAFGSIIDVVAGPAAFRDYALWDEFVTIARIESAGSGWCWGCCWCWACGGRVGNFGLNRQGRYCYGREGLGVFHGDERSPNPTGSTVDLDTNPGPVGISAVGFDCLVLRNLCEDGVVGAGAAPDVRVFERLDHGLGFGNWFASRCAGRCLSLFD